MQAIVLAGQQNVAFQSVSACQYEAEVPIAGRPMVEWVILALKEAERVDQVILVGPRRSRSDGVIVTEAGKTLWESLASGLRQVSPSATQVLLVTADIPLITGAIIDEFIEHCPLDADLVYPVVEKERTLSRFPETMRTYVRLAGMTVTGGNMVVANPKVLPKVEERAKVLIAHRKSPLRLARDVGLILLLKLMTGRLSLSDAERRVSQVFGITGRVLECPHPEVGVDVDKIGDFTMAERVLSAAFKGRSGDGWIEQSTL